MARPYGEKFLRTLEKSNLNTLGIQLAKLCVKANLPATFVAVALDTSSTTVYSWFRGQGIREQKRKVVEVFIDLLKEDFKSGVLPVANLDDAQEYIEAMTGKKVH
jgi:hypothetical protein